LLHNTHITELPDDLVVGGALYIEHIKVESLPDNLMPMEVITYNKIKMSEKTQMKIISNHKNQFHMIKNPTEKAITMQKLLWKI